jgi:GTP-binding protein HflX
MSQLFDTAKPLPRAVILAVQLPDVSDAELASSLEEIARLGKTLGLGIVGRVTQRRARLAPGVVVGEGKLRELARWTGGTGKVHVGPPLKKQGPKRPEQEDVEERAAADEEASAAEREALPPGERAGVVLVDHDLTPSQARNLENATGAEVIDRSGLILAIFQRHARSREARLQVEIARLTYIAPRLRETGIGQDRQGGGIGAKGAGETSAELDRRKIRDRIAELRHELAAIERESSTRRKRRGELNKVALVGYTNAGKSSWMRALTGSDVLVQDKLFATLDTTVRALQPETTPRILVSDTVGFIKKLPHDLVASFRSTLDEAREGDLLVHVVDASDPAFPAQIEVTRAVLHDIGADASPALLVLNKADRLSPEERARLAAEHPNALLLSSRDPADVARLHARIASHFERDMAEAELVIPYAKSKLVAEAHASARVLSEEHKEDGTHLRLRAAPEQLAKLKAQLANA